MSYIKKLESGHVFSDIYSSEIKNLILSSKEKEQLLPYFSKECKDVFSNFFRKWENLDDEVETLESKLKELCFIGEYFFVNEIKEHASSQGWLDLIDKYKDSTMLEVPHAVTYEIDVNKDLEPVFIVEHKGKVLNKEFPAKAFDKILVENVGLTSGDLHFYSFISGIYSQRRTIQSSYVAELIGYKNS